MSLISIYDIASSTWQTSQTATGASGKIPATRRQFCTALSTAPDHSSFQITMNGGFQWSTNTRYNDVWVLTVPAFRWIQVSEQNANKSASNATIGRVNARCNMYKNSQMIEFGGSVLTDSHNISSGDDTLCKNKAPVLRVLDTTTYKWKDSLNPSLNYTVPKIVSDVIGGNGAGNAKMTQPEDGWNSTGLQSIFAQRVNKPSASNSSAPAPSSSPASKSSKSHASAIAGGVVGGVVGLVLIAGFLFFCLRRRKRSRLVETGPYEKGPYEKAELPGLSKRPMSPQELPVNSNLNVELPGNHRVSEMESLKPPKSPPERSNSRNGSRFGEEFAPDSPVEESNHRR